MADRMTPGETDGRQTESVRDPDLWALVDRLLLDQGRLDGPELLMAAGLLDYRDYEAWRMGRAPTLEAALRTTPEAAVDLLQRAFAYARKLKLEKRHEEHKGSGAWGQPLCAGIHPGLVDALGSSFAPPAGRPQLDLFQDSSTGKREEEIREALAERRMGDARTLVDRFVQQNPCHQLVPGFLRLLQAAEKTSDHKCRGPEESGADRAGQPPEHGGRRRWSERWEELEGLEVLAHHVLGHRARDFLVPLWVDLAERLSGLPFDPGRRGQDAADAWARAGRWPAARLAVESRPDWQKEPALVLAHAEACWHLRDILAARRDWLSLCWQHAPIAERTLSSRSLPDRRLADLWNRFGDLDADLDTEDFPSWVLLAEPGIAKALAAEEAPAGERGDCFRLVLRLATGSDGDGDMDLRRDLAQTHPTLLRLFLAGRR